MSGGVSIYCHHTLGIPQRLFYSENLVRYTNTYYHDARFSEQALATVKLSVGALRISEAPDMCMNGTWEFDCQGAVPCFQI